MLGGCQIGYYLHSGYNQAKLAGSRESIDKVLRSSHLDEKKKAKLRLVQEVKKFGEEKLGLASSRNYTTFIQLDEPHVTYIVQAAYAHELKPYLWKFPFVGEVPYKGYFRKKLADEEAAGFDKTQYDVDVRGVSAYSTLGWFQDSVLSSMLRYEDTDLAELILHETIHTTLYVKSAAEFNERLATYMGHEGMKLFFKARGAIDELKSAEKDTHDQKLFSEFITRELGDLKKWYEDHKGQVSAENKAARIKEIQDRYTRELKPRMKTRNYDEFAKRELNNAILLAYQTYEYSLDDFEKLYQHFGRDYSKTFTWLKTLKNDEHPGETLKKFVSGAL